MSETIEVAKEHLEHAAHVGGHDDGHARKTAMLVAVLAAALALSELGEKAAQNAYLTHHIQASDDWAFYQAKTIRMNMYAMFADTWESQPGMDPKKIAAARANFARMNDDPQAGDGRKQLSEKAKGSEAAREKAFHRYHFFEMAVGGLQISIVLASVSVVTRVAALALGAGVLGAAAAGFAILTATGAV
jgi:hypothetical protein